MTAKVWIGLALCAALAAGCDAEAAARKEAIELARSACYERPKQEVFQATRSLVAARYSIASESEHRGRIDTDAAGRTRVSVEIDEGALSACVHEFTCYRVRFRVTGDGARAVEDELHLAIYRQLR